jgi:hypothetical protein
MWKKKKGKAKDADVIEKKLETETAAIIAKLNLPLANPASSEVASSSVVGEPNQSGPIPPPAGRDDGKPA